MGETGCGKTRMVEFLSRVWLLESALVMLKVHGGTTREDIRAKVSEANEFAISHGTASKP